MQRFVQSDYRATEAALPDRRSRCRPTSTSPSTTPTTTSTRPRTRSPGTSPRRTRTSSGSSSSRAARSSSCATGSPSSSPTRPSRSSPARARTWPSTPAHNAEGKTLRELTGEPMRSIPAFRSPGPRLELLDEQGIHAAPHVPDARQPHRGAAARRPRPHPGRHHGPSTSGSTTSGRYDYEGRIFATPVVNPCVARQGHRRARAGHRARRQGRAPAPRAGERPARHPLAVPPGVRPVLGPRPGGRAPRRPPRVRQRLPAATSTRGRAPSGEYVAFRPKTFVATSPTTAGPSRTPSRRRSATACSPASPA